MLLDNEPKKLNAFERWERKHEAILETVSLWIICTLLIAGFIAGSVHMYNQIDFTELTAKTVNTVEASYDDFNDYRDSIKGE